MGKSLFGVENHHVMDSEVVITRFGYYVKLPVKPFWRLGMEGGDEGESSQKDS